MKQRDFIGGLMEHEAIMEMVSKRCERVIAVISPLFLQSSANTWIVNFTQANAVEQCRRKILPVIYKECELPSGLRYLTALRYRPNFQNLFWTKLAESLRAEPQQMVSHTQIGQMPR